MRLLVKELIQQQPLQQTPAQPAMSDLPAADTTQASLLAKHWLCRLRAGSWKLLYCNSGRIVLGVLLIGV